MSYKKTIDGLRAAITEIERKGLDPRKFYIVQTDEVVDLVASLQDLVEAQTRLEVSEDLHQKIQETLKKLPFF